MNALGAHIQMVQEEEEVLLKRTSESSFLLHVRNRAALTAHVNLSKQGVSKATGLDTPCFSNLLQRTLLASAPRPAGTGASILRGGCTPLITWFTLIFARRS